MRPLRARPGVAETGAAPGTLTRIPCQPLRLHRGGTARLGQKIQTACPGREGCGGPEASSEPPRAATLPGSRAVFVAAVPGAGGPSKARAACAGSTRSCVHDRDRVQVCWLSHGPESRSLNHGPESRSPGGQRPVLLVRNWNSVCWLSHGPESRSPKAPGARQGPRRREPLEHPGPRDSCREGAACGRTGTERWLGRRAAGEGGRAVSASQTRRDCAVNAP